MPPRIKVRGTSLRTSSGQDHSQLPSYVGTIAYILVPGWQGVKRRVARTRMEAG